MSNMYRERARDVFTADSLVSEIDEVNNAHEDIPDIGEEGDPARGYNAVGVSVSGLVGITSYSADVYIWDGEYWKLREANESLTDAFTAEYYIGPWEAVYIRIHTIIGDPTHSMKLRRNYVV